MQGEAKRAYDAARYRTRRQPKPADVIEAVSDTDLAYLAGLTDADGTIYTTHTKRQSLYYPNVVWAMTHRPTIEWVAELLASHAVVKNNHTSLRRGTASWGQSTT
jgi:hypothetical protein